MSPSTPYSIVGLDSQDIEQQQHRHQREEFRGAMRALLMTPLMSPGHEDFSAVRRQADALRQWFSRESGWTLLIEREGARLYKRPADLADTTRGLPDYERRRYVLLSLACAALERADAQITLRVLGERLLTLSTDPVFALGNFSFTLGTQHERRDLVTVCRTLLDLGVLQRVAGDEEAFINAGNDHADALYDVQRRALAGMLAAARGPSTWPPEEAPVTLEERLHALVDEYVPDSDEGRRTALRHHLARRLLDDPVVYTSSLNPEAQAYFVNQRGALATRLCDATGLAAEQRAEGLALVDESGALTDLAMPAEGTDAHVTLLVAEYLANDERERAARPASSPFKRTQDIADFVREARERYGRFWRKSAREAGSERELAAIAIERLEKLQLVACRDDSVCPLPALARFSLGETDVRTAGPRRNIDVPDADTFTLI
jgi:uncharacterized protein (TIGR02678 family)